MPTPLFSKQNLPSPANFHEKNLSQVYVFRLFPSFATLNVLCPAKRKLFSILRRTTHLTADLSGTSPSPIKYMFFTTLNSADSTSLPLVWRLTASQLACCVEKHLKDMTNFQFWILKGHFLVFIFIRFKAIRQGMSFSFTNQRLVMLEVLNKRRYLGQRSYH